MLLFMILGFHCILKFVIFLSFDSRSFVHRTFFSGISSTPSRLKANIDKTFTCHTVRQNTKRDATEVAMIIFVTDRGIGGGANANYSKKDVFFFTGHFFERAMYRVIQPL
jgi:hypothetical protein